MRPDYRCAILLLFLLLSVPSATAFQEEDIIIDPIPWAVAGGLSVPIRIHVSNDTLNSSEINSTSVTLTLHNLTLGGFDKTTKFLDSNGDITFYFLPNYVKGEDNVDVLVYLNESVHNSTMTTIKVDHAEPKYYSRIVYPSEALVATNVTITIQLKDRYGNEVDGKNEVEFLECRDSPDSMGGFINGTEYSHFLSVPIDDNGRGLIEYHLGTIAGLYLLTVIAPSTVVNNQQYLEIDANPDSPTTMELLVYSNSDKDNIDPHTALADGTDIFSLYYLASDRYGNPVPNEIIYVEIRKGTDVTPYAFKTNYRGMIFIDYGPSTILHKVDLYSYLMNYSHIKSFATLEFIAGGPVLFSIAAIPPVIPSRDVPTREDSNTTVQVRVLDTTGRGLPNETVRISIEDESYNFNFPELRVLDTSSFVKDTDIDDIFVVTDDEGYATATMYAARFNQSAEGYSTNWVGVANLSSVLLNETNFIATSTVTFKNYPFLRMESGLDKSTIGINETVNLSICLFGDGYTPEHKPIDALLVFGRSTMMLDNKKQFTTDPAIHVRWAVKNFTGYFDDANDRFGLWTYGDVGWADLLNNTLITKSYLVGADTPNDRADDIKAVEGDTNVKGYEGYPGNNRTYTNYATADTGNYDDSAFLDNLGGIQKINEAVRNITPFLESQNAIWGESLRYGIYRALNDSINHHRSTAYVNAIIVLVDQNYNWFGDPLADGSPIYCNSTIPNTCVETPTNSHNWVAFPLGGPYEDMFAIDANYTPSTSWQNMSNYARDNNVLIYVVSYTDSFNSADQETLRILAEATGGKHMHANNPDELNATFGRIAQELIELASVNTSLDLNFSSMNVTTVEGTEYIGGNSIFNYTHIPNVSTYVNSWKDGKIVPDRLPIPPYPSNLYPPDLKTDQNGTFTNYPYTINQTDQWANNSLGIYVGNMSIGQYWCANIMLEAKTLGGIEIFGTSSKACFIDEELGEECNIVPPLFLSVLENVSGEFVVPNALEIIVENNSWEFDNSTEYLYINWNLNYTGEYTVPVKQNISHRFSSDGITWTSWAEYDIQVIEEVGLIPSVSKLPVKDRAGWVQFRIHAIELGANENSDTYSSPSIPIPRSPTIRVCNIPQCNI